MSYKSKAKDSFDTKMNLFIYDKVTNDIDDFSVDDFKDYTIKPNLVDEYTMVYWQHYLRDSQLRRLTQERFRLTEEC